MKDRIVAITGGSGALGRVVAAEAVRRGARVAVIDHAAEAPEGLAQALGADALILGGVDLTRENEAKRAIEAAVERFGGLHALLNIAGGFVWQTVADGDPATWPKLYALNLGTALNACRAALPHLERSGSGRIVNVGAAGALKAAAGMGAYAASKSAVHKLTESLAEEQKGRVTVNAVLPSIIDTPANRRDMTDADFSKWVAPKDLAAVMLFLASEEAGAVTGALVPVTGGV